MNIISIEVPALPIIAARSGTSAKSGQKYEVPAKQVAYFHTGELYPVKGEVVVPDSGPYRAGRYMLAGNCFAPSEYGVKFDDRAVNLVSLDDAYKQLQAMIAAFKESQPK